MFAVCNVLDKYVYISGGAGLKSKVLDTCIRYNIDLDRWERVSAHLQ